MIDNKIHPAAELLPMMAEAELKQLAESIKRDGQRDPIERLDGAIIDGRNRLEACRLAGVLPTFREIDPPADPIAYVLDKNVSRRHLTTSQLAMVAVRAKRLYAEQAKERSRANLKLGTESPECANLRTRESDEVCRSSDQAAETVGVGGRSVDFAETVMIHGSHPLQEMVHRGEVAVSAAALVAKQHSQDEQAAIVSAGPDAVKKEAATIRLQQRKESQPAPVAIPSGNLFDDDPLPSSPLAEEPARDDRPAPPPASKKPLSVADLINRPSPVQSYRVHTVQLNGSDAKEAARAIVDSLGVEHAYAVGLQLVAIGEAS